MSSPFSPEQIIRQAQQLSTALDAAGEYTAADSLDRSLMRMAQNNVQPTASLQTLQYTLQQIFLLSQTNAQKLDQVVRAMGGIGQGPRKRMTTPPAAPQQPVPPVAPTTMETNNLNVQGSGQQDFTIGVNTL